MSSDPAQEPAHRTVILLRHGKSAYPPGVPDHDRPLSPRGTREAGLAGSWISRNLPRVDRVICSTATRTRQTLAETGLAAGVPVSYTKAVYEAFPEELAELLTALAPEERTVLLVGHAPGIPALAEQLAGNGSDPGALDRLRTKFPTSALAVIAVDREWPSLPDGHCRLTAFVVPRTTDTPTKAR